MSTGTTRREAENNRGLILLVSAIVLSITLLSFLLPIAESHRKAVVEAELLRQAEARRIAAVERGALYVPRVGGRLPATDPESAAWAAAPTVEVPLQRQTVTMPVLETATVASARIQGLTDGDRIAWRVSWSDDSNDANVDSGRFSDAVALQFPIDPTASFTMGARGKLVHILHWKALWQKDVDEHYQDVPDLHPNYWADLYWFAEGRPFIVPSSFADSRSHEWFPAFRAGNPMADIFRSSAVEELVAEGFGSLTSQPECLAVGRGTWRDGRWQVVFSRPLRSGDELDYQFGRGGRGSLGIAVWDGSAGNVGGRKHWSNWVEFEVSL